jgi:hypothetical protein
MVLYMGAIGVERVVPGMLGARLTACKAHYSMGHYDAAARALARCLAVKGGSSAAHLLGAQVSLIA